MNHLKRLSVALALTSVLAGSAFACETPDPGQTQTPPCAVANSIVNPDDAAVPAESLTPGESSAETVASVAKVAMSLFESLLSIF